MKKITRRSFLSATGATLACAGLVGCSSDTTTSTATTTDTSSTQTDTSSSVSTEPIELEVWHMATDPDDSAAKIVLQALEDFQVENPNITIVDSGQATDNQKTRLSVAAAGDELPDLFFTWGYEYSSSMVTSGKILDMTPYITDELKAKIKPGGLDPMIYDDKYYGLPDNGWYQMIYINTDLFEQNNIAVPVTFDELMEACTAFAAIGIGAISTGGSQSNTFTKIYDSILLRLAGAEQVMNTYTDPTLMDDPKALEAAQILYDMGAAGCFDEACYTLSNPDCSTGYTMGMYPIVVLNAGFVGNFEAETSVVAGKSIPVPTFFEMGYGYDKDNLAAFNGDWSIGATTEHPAEAFALAEYLSTALARGYYEAGTHQIAFLAEDDWDDSNQSDLYKEITALSEDMVIIPGANEIRPTEVLPTMSDLCVALSRCKIEPAQFIEDVKALYNQ